MPIVGGVLDLKNCQRINLGGYNNGAYLQRLLQLRFPKLSPVFTLTRYVNSAEVVDNEVFVLFFW